MVKKVKKKLLPFKIESKMKSRPSKKFTHFEFSCPGNLVVRACTDSKIKKLTQKLVSTFTQTKYLKNKAILTGKSKKNFF